MVNVDDEEDEEDGEEEEDDDEEEDGTLDDKKYFLKIDINNYYDYYQGKEGVTNVFEINMTDPKFTKVQRKLSNIKTNQLVKHIKEKKRLKMFMHILLKQLVIFIELIEMIFSPVHQKNWLMHQAPIKIDVD